MEADLAVGAALVPVAVMSLREVRHWREVPFAALPAVFAIHQFIEAFVWWQQSGTVSASVGHCAAVSYVFIAWPFLPAFVPIAVFLLQPRHAQRRVAPFVAVGLVVAAYLSYVVLFRPVGVVVHPHALEYVVGVVNPWLWAVLYVVAVVGSLVSSNYAAVRAFGVLNLIGLTVVAVFYFEAFTSLWCAYAAACSVTVWLHMRGRRALPEREFHDARVRESAS